MKINITKIIVFVAITIFIVSCNKVGPPEEGDTVELEMTYGTPDSVWYDSKHAEEPSVIKMEKPSFKGDFYEIISTMHVGESASFKCHADSVFIKTFKMQKPNEFSFVDSISFNVKLLSIKTSDGNQK